MPLNRELYAALQRRFGKVRIANQNEAMTATSHIEVSRGERRLSVLHAGEYYCVNCDYCADTRFRLWINHRFGQLDPYTGRRMLFLAHCYNEDCLADYKNLKDLENKIFGLRNSADRRMVMAIDPRGERITTAPLHVVDPPGYLFPFPALPPNHPAVLYMVGERHFPIEVLHRHHITYCLEADPRWPLAQNRIVFPCHVDGVLVGWQCRYIGDVDWRARDIPKYWTCPGFRKGRMLFNLDRAKDKPFVVVAEGPVDVLSWGDVTVAAFGRTLSSQQRQLLLTHWGSKPIILLFDGDAAEEIREAEAALKADSPTARVLPVFLPPGCDPGSLAPEVVMAYVYNAAAAAGLPMPGI